MHAAWFCSCLCVGIVLSHGAGQVLDPNARIKVEGDKHWFLDQHNRFRIFRGVNVVEKAFPWYPATMLNETILDDLRDWGMNVVRLGTMWAGTEPLEGQYNATYVQILRNIVDECAKRGIYTLMDMHQDVISSRYRSYDGVPRWLVDKFPESPNPYPWPLETIGQWEDGYFTQAVSLAFQHMYNNTADAITRWGEMWRHLATSFKDHTYVLGYEFINEPWVGDYITFEDLLLPGNAGRYNLLPNYDALNTFIREVDNTTLVFYEPVVHGTVYTDLEFGSGFDHVPGGAAYKDRSVYSWHYYCWFLEFIPSNATDAEREEAKADCNTQLLPGILKSQQDTVNQIGGASMLTEFGLCNTDETTINIDCNFTLQKADEWFLSWNYWDVNDGKWYRNGHRQWGKITPFVRSYAYAIAGTPQSMSFDESTMLFDLKYQADAAISEPTEIFLPKLRYPQGFRVTTSDNLRHEVEASGDILRVYLQDANSLEAHVQVTKT